MYEKRLMPDTIRPFTAKGLTYHILSTLKPGPGARVYKALRSDCAGELKQEVILKVFSKHSTGFKEEFESLSEIRSPYCVQLLGFESFKGQKAFVLESIPGVSLLRLIHHFPLSPPEIRCLLSQIHEGLKDLRRQNLCHGDLSLNNVIINREGKIKFIDFGRGNYAGQSRGTPPFTAPEILQGGRPNFSSDLFSLGVLEVFLKKPHQLNILKNKKSEDFVSNDHPLLTSDPQKRKFPALSHTPEDRSSISYKVRDLLTFFDGENWRTGDMTPDKRHNRWFSALVFLSLLAGGPLSGSRPRSAGLLQIHTHHWVLIRLNNMERYAPFEMSLSPGIHHLEWKSPKGGGEKRLYIHPGKTLFLTDEDFKK